MKILLHAIGKYLLMSTLLFGAILLTLEGISSSTLEAQAATVVISDDTFNSGSWTVHERSEFGASQTNSQSTIGTRTYRAMQHILPAPENAGEKAIIEVMHVYDDVSYDPGTQGDITSIDYSEDMVLFSLPWDEAFITSMVALEQDGKLYRSSAEIGVIADLNWTNRSLLNLTASSFVAWDGSDSKPDFSASGSPIKFGYYRFHSRYRDSPVSSSVILSIGHGIDNWRVEINNDPPEPPPNRAPIAVDDEDKIRPEKYIIGSWKKWCNPLLNDEDPDGDPFFIQSIDTPNYGVVTLDDDKKGFEYLAVRHYDDKFYYTISDGELTARAQFTMYLCSCFIRNLFQKEICIPQHSKYKAVVAAPAQGTGIIDFFHQVRVNVMEKTDDGRRYVDIFNDTTPEIAKILTIDRPDLRDSAIATLTMLHEVLQNLVNGDGNAIISQDLIDGFESLLLDLSAAGSAELQQTISEEMARLGPLDDYVGLTVKEAKTKTIGVPKFPWPVFRPATTTNPD